MNGKKELITRAKAAAAALLLTTLLLTSLILTVKHSTPAQPSTVTIPVEIPTETAVKVQVYRGGRLVAEQEKVGDRLLYNFWALILNAFLGRYYNSPVSIYRVDGTTFTQPEWGYVYGASSALYPLLAVGFGSSSSSVSFFDYELPSLLARVDVPSTGYSLADNGTHIIVSATASWTASSAATVADVGLYWKGYSFGSTSAFYVLIARDVLSSSIAVVANDVVIVTYTITIAYSKPPLLKNLAALIANYILGAQNYGKAVSFITWDGTSTTIMDIGHDAYASPNDNAKEYLYIGVTSDQRPFMPSLSSVGILAETTSGVTVNWGYNSTHVWFTLPAAPILMPSGGTVTAVYARIRDTDIDASTTTNSKQVMVLYFPLDTPVTVPAGSGVKFEFTIYFRW